MKKLFTAMAIAFFMVAAPVHAQFGFGLRGGLNLTSLDISEKTLDSENNAGFFIGPTVKLTIPVIGIGLDASLMYDQKKSSIESDDVVTVGGLSYPTGTTTTTTIRDESVVLPINVRYQFGLGDMASVFVKAGPQFAWNIGGKNYTLNAAKETFQLKKSTASLNIGAGAIVLSHLEVALNYNIALGNTSEVSVLNTASTLTSTATGAVGSATGLYDSKSLKSNTFQLSVAYYF